MSRGGGRTICKKILALMNSPLCNMFDQELKCKTPVLDKLCHTVCVLCLMKEIFKYNLESAGLVMKIYCFNCLAMTGIILVMVNDLLNREPFHH